MKRTLNTRLEVIDWIAANARDEGQFEVMREQMNFNFIYYSEYFLDIGNDIGAVVLLKKK